MGANVVHVMPCGDLIEHTEGFGTCACGPAVEVVRAGVSCDGGPVHVRHVGWLVTHHSLDGRERREV